VRALSIEQWFGADLHASVYRGPSSRTRSSEPGSTNTLKPWILALEVVLES
jgi:hypothetical protein